MRNRILIFGYFGCGNLGDETNLGQLIDWIREIEPKANLTVVSANPGQTSRDYQVLAVSKYHIPGIIRAVKSADWVIGGGGNLFQDLSSLRSLLYYSTLIWLARIFRIKVFLYGQGIGPIRSAIGKLIARWALSQVDIMTIRDQLSQHNLHGLQVSKPKIHLAADPLLAKEPLPVGEIDPDRNYTGRGPLKKVGLIIRSYPLMNQKHWSWLLKSFPKGETEFYLLALQDNEERLLKYLAGMTGMKALPVQKNWRVLQQTVADFDLIISCRLHGLIAAIVQDVPALGLAADPKIEAFCLEHEVEYLLFDWKTQPTLLYNQIIFKLRKSIGKIKSAWLSSNRWQSQALENRVILRKVLKGEL